MDLDGQMREERGEREGDVFSFRVCILLYFNSEDGKKLKRQLSMSHYGRTVQIPLQLIQ